MKDENKKPKMRDFRNKSFFMMDDEYMNGYAKICGWKATIVYNSLCRHANKDQYSYPSIRLMAEENGVSKDTIIAGIKSLTSWNIIGVQKFRTKFGVYKNNGYDLYDKSEWQPKPPATQVDDIDMDKKGENLATQVDDSHLTKSTTATYKETHKKETHIDDDEEVKIPPKKTNPLHLTRGQVFAYLKSFPGLTTSELNEQANLCNNYMGMSSWEIKNPGLFFRKWLTRFMSEKRAKEIENQKRIEQEKSMPELTEEQRQRNLVKIAEIREKVISKLQ